MAQAEDTELRDLVVEALEKNGSLAKIRALLRANIFLVFEDDCENIKQNVNLDNILKLPEGILCLSLVHDFLEFCNLKNTLFVYMSESRQGKEYPYEGHSSLLEKLNLAKHNKNKEPVLVTIVKNILQQQMKIGREQNMKNTGNNYKEEQNNTYIVHEDSTSSISHSNSDNSSDEKNKLHLRLQLDNSDTDTSSDSTRGKTSSEYIPSEHIFEQTNQSSNFLQQYNDKEDLEKPSNSDHLAPDKNKNYSNSDSTSYIDIKLISPPDTIHIPNTHNQEEKSDKDLNKVHSKTETQPSPKFNTANIVSNHYTGEMNKNDKQKSDISENSLSEYSLDFTSPASPKKDLGETDTKRETDTKSVKSDHNVFENSAPRNYAQESIDQKSISSISTSDAADIISDISNPLQQKYIDRNMSSNTKKSILNYSKKNYSENSKLFEDDSGDFSDSPIPSLSNLSLDIHSD